MLYGGSECNQLTMTNQNLCGWSTPAWKHWSPGGSVRCLQQLNKVGKNSIKNLFFLILLPGNICSDRPKYFPWLTFNFRLRTGHKSELRYLRTQTRCFRVMQQWTRCGNGCVRMWYARAGKKSCYLLRMLHPLVPLCNNLLTPGLVQTPLGQKLLSLQNLTPFGW